MDTHYLDYILAIARKRNMTKAADELYVSQSSLSQYLAKLEQELGTPLFLRTKGELIPTQAGELYIKAAENVIAIKKQLYKEISGLENKGRITIGTTSQFGFRTLSRILPLFQKEFPDYTVEISEAYLPSLIRLMKEEGVDFALMATTDTAHFPDSYVEILKEEEIFLAVPKAHPYTEKSAGQSISPEELSAAFCHDNFLLARKGTAIRSLSDQLFSSQHFSPGSTCETNNISATLNMVANQAGVAFVAESCLDYSLPVVYYSLEPKLIRLNLLVRRKNLIMGPAEERFCEHIRSCFL